MIDNTGSKSTAYEAVTLWIETGDDRYFTIIYNSYRDNLFRYIKKIVHDDDIAHDITQDVFISVLKNIHQYDPIRGMFSTWIYNIAKNSALAYTKFEKKQFALRDNVAHSLYVKQNTSNEDGEFSEVLLEKQSTGSDNVSEINVLFKSIVQITIQEIMNLSDNYRDFMFDREIRNLSYEEISTRYAVKLNTVKSKIRIGREIVMHKTLHHIKELGIDVESLQSIITIKKK